jgi:hypothetical protein
MFRCIWRLATAFITLSAFAADPDGLMHVEGKTLFPIGFYHFPENAEAAAMAANGVNLFRCGDTAELDRAHALGAYGWLPLPMHAPLTPEHGALIREAAAHPALAVWEGPDEMVWNFTAYSGLARNGTHERTGAWWDQTPKAVAYAKEQAAIIMPNVHAWAARIRELDGANRPIWFNEAYRSDVAYVRQYMDVVDITGCDLYPIKSTERLPAHVADSTERFTLVGEGKPVYMVLQAFSWHELREKDGQNLPAAYPTFVESRLMAWASIAHGARGVLYWGSAYTKNAEFLQGIYAVTRELGALQPFLIANELYGVSVKLIEEPTLAPQRGVAHVARVNDGEGLVVLINEDEKEHMGVELQGLSALEGRTLHLNFGDETLSVRNGRVLTRMQPYEVKIFTTTPDAAGTDVTGRDFGLVEAATAP